MTSKFLRGFASIFSSKAFIYAISIILSPLIVRILGSGKYGDYAFILSILGIVMVFVNSGIFDGVRKFIAESRAGDFWEERVFGFYFQVGFFLSGIAAASFALLSFLGYPDAVFGDGFDMFFLLLGVLIICQQLQSLVRGGLMGLGLEHQSEPLRVAKQIIMAICGVYLAYIGLDVVGLLAGHIIANLFVVVIGFSFLATRLDFKQVFTFTPNYFPKRELLSFNLSNIILILLTTSLYHVDILLLRGIVGSQETGYYRAALSVAEFLWFAPIALQTVLLHSAADLWSAGDTSELNNLVSKATRYNTSFTLLLAIGLATLAHEFIPIYYGVEFKPSINPLLLLLPGTIGFALARPIFAVGQGIGKMRLLILATGSAALVNFLLNMVLIPTYGMVGAAIATSISYGMMFIAHLFAARLIGFDPIADVRTGRIIVVAFSTGLIILSVNVVLKSDLLSLLIVPTIGFVIYAWLSIRLGVISNEDYTKVVNFVRNRVNNLSG